MQGEAIATHHQHLHLLCLWSKVGAGPPGCSGDHVFLSSDRSPEP